MKKNLLLLILLSDKNKSSRERGEIGIIVEINKIKAKYGERGY
jgi:hypothetical protein